MINENGELGELIALFVTTLFDWSCARGFTSMESIPFFKIPFLLVYSFLFFIVACTYFLCLLHFFDGVVIFIQLFLPIKQKKKGFSLLSIIALKLIHA